MTTTQAGKTSAITKHQKGATYFLFNNYYNYLFSSSVCASNSTIDSTLKKNAFNKTRTWYYKTKQLLEKDLN